MKHGHALAIGTLALALVACGGGGHHGGTTSTTPTVDPITSTASASYQIEAVLTDATNANGTDDGLTTSAVVDPGYRYQDPLNIQILDRVTFELVSYTGSGTSLKRNVVASGATFLADSPSRFGDLSPTNGAFTVGSSDTNNTRYTVTSSYLGQNFTTQFRINPRLNQVRIRGAVVSSVTGSDVTVTQPTTGATASSPTYQGVYGAEIDFYEQRDPLDSTSRQIIVQRVRTAQDGTFRASVPIPTDSNGNPVPIRFAVVQPDGYDGTFSYPVAGSASYSTSVVTASDIASLPLVEKLELDTSVSTPTEGNYYLVPGLDIVHDTATTFHLGSYDDLSTDAQNLIMLTPSGTATTTLKGRSVTKAH